MKKTRKHIIGVFGLVLVAMMTFLAIGIDTPGASATSATDTITVRVVGTVPKVSLLQPSGNITTTSSNQALKIDYENVRSITIKMAYTDKNGVNQTVTLSDPSDPAYSPDGAPGSLTEGVNLSNYGTGKFTFTVSGTGEDGVTSTDTLEVTYYPVISNIEEGDDGEVYVDIDYDPDVVKDGEVYVYVDGKKTDIVLRIPEDIGSDGKILIPLDDLGPGDHKISVEIVAYDEEGKPVDGIYIEDNDIPYETVEVPDTNAPDTGGLFRNLNITKEDYLVTGLIVFFVFGVVAFGIVARNRKNRR